MQHPHTAAKDTQKKVVPVIPLRKDSAKTVKKDSSVIKTTVIKTRGIDSLTAAGPDSFGRVLLDTLNSDSTAAVTAPPVATTPLTWAEDTAFMHLLTGLYTKTNFHFLSKEGEVHVRQSKEYLFYSLIGILILFALIKQLFPKYYQNVFKLIFQASFRQKQTREQMMQQVLPALLMNVLFVIVTGLFIALLAEIRKWLDISFWLLTTYCVTLLALVYIFKYLVIQFMGWVFNAREQASTYGFIVFLVNKVIGLALLPLLWLLAFSPNGGLQQITVTLAAVIVILLLIFRYVVSMTVIRNTLSVHPLHFFIYLCAIELMPMLILYKVLFSFVGKSF